MLVPPALHHLERLLPKRFSRVNRGRQGLLRPVTDRQLQKLLEAVCQQAAEGLAASEQRIGHLQRK